jgi:hypothetical protein
MSQIPNLYPFQREWGIDSICLGKYTTLTTNWNESKNLIIQIRNCLQNSKIHSAVETVATAGSLGRMEAYPKLSDADLIIVVSDELNLDSQEGKNEAEKAYKSVWDAINNCSILIDSPKLTGVFGEATNKKQLLDYCSVGRANERLEVFGKRLLLLLETQPVYQDEKYTNLINEVVERYADKYVKQDPTKEWTFLLNDLIRYFRALAVNYQWDFDNEAEKWTLRNVKLRHSRIVMYSGLLSLLGEASKERKDKVLWLQERLTLTPLERLALVYAANEDWNFHRLAGLYNVFLSQLSIEEVRKKLNVSYNERYNNPEFASLKANSDSLVAELLRFVFSRRGYWTERFFEYLIF